MSMTPRSTSEHPALYTHFVSCTRYMQILVQERALSMTPRSTSE
jgi:hypothetical protein